MARSVVVFSVYGNVFELMSHDSVSGSVFHYFANNVLILLFLD